MNIPFVLRIFGLSPSLQISQERSLYLAIHGRFVRVLLELLLPLSRLYCCFCGAVLFFKGAILRTLKIYALHRVYSRLRRGGTLFCGGLEGSQQEVQIILTPGGGSQIVT